MRILNNKLLARFVKNHADLTKAMQKFIDIVEEATRPEPNNFYSNISTHYICYKKFIAI